MKTPRLHIRLALLASSSIIAVAISTAAFGQHVPSVHGSMDAVTVLPTTQPAGATPPATLPTGHPPLANAPKDPVASMHSGMAAAKTGALRVNVSQGTK